jgi:hypothetical protein
MRVLCLLFAAAAFAYAQLEPDTITISAIQSGKPEQPDYTTLSVSIQVDSALGLGEVLKPLAVLGISESELVEFDQTGGRPICDEVTYQCGPARQFFRFYFETTLSKLKETLASLARAKAAAPPEVDVRYSIDTRMLFHLPSAPECAYPALIAGARRQAEKMAAAAGLVVGGIIAMSDGTSSVPDASWVSEGYALSGSPSILSAVGVEVVFTPPVCAAVVQFKLSR